LRATQRSAAWGLTHNVELLAALALVMVYLATMSGHLHSIDGLLMYNQAGSLAYDGSLRFTAPISPDAPWMASRYGIGLSLLYVPGLLVYLWLFPNMPGPNGLPWSPERLYSDPAYMVVGAPVHIFIAAASAYVVALFIRELGMGRGAALWGMALYGLASPAFVFSRGDYAQPLGGLCWILGLYSALRFRGSGRSGYLVACAGSVFYAVMSRPVEGSLLLPAMIAMLAPGLKPSLWPRQAWQALRAVGLGYIAGILLTLLVNWGRFGSPLATGYEAEGWWTPLWTGLAGALFSPGRGILWEFPAVLLVPLGLRALWNSEHRGVGLALVGLAGLQLMNVATWFMWWGGWNWGLRLFVPALPLLAVLAGCGVSALPSRAHGWIPAALLVAGAIWAVPCIITDLYGGYGPAYDSSDASFRLDAYPPIGAWAFFDHWRALSPADYHAADILWLRMARATGNVSLVVPLLFGLAAAALAARVTILLGYFPGLSLRPSSTGKRSVIAEGERPVAEALFGNDRRV
jgi:hypothetical protein